MATNNTYSSLLSRPASGSSIGKGQSYERQSGATSGLGQPQNRWCATGYRWDTNQGKCIPSNNATSGYMSNPSQGMNQGGQTQAPAKPPAPQFQNYSMPRPNQLSPYAQLLGMAVDLNLQNPQQPYSQQTNQTIGSQIGVDPIFTGLVLRR